MVKKTSKKLKMRRRSVKKGAAATAVGFTPINFTIYGEGLDNTDIDEHGKDCTIITGLTINNTTADLYAAVRNRRPGGSSNTPAGIKAFRDYQQWQFQLYANDRFLGLPVDNNHAVNLRSIPRTLFILNATKTEQEEFENQQRQLNQRNFQVFENIDN
jgi:hypothetical protein